MVIKNLELPVDVIADVCRKHGVEELAVFGSVLRDDFGPDSDLDFLVVFKNNDAGPWMGKFMDLEEALSQVLGRRVDVVDKRGVEQSENYIRRRDILSSAKVIYVAR
ncbi:MAG: nucleotidyltransferase domain-containing protein [Planctomycetota bacterium]